MTTYLNTIIDFKSNMKEYHNIFCSFIVNLTERKSYEQNQQRIFPLVKAFFLTARKHLIIFKIKSVPQEKLHFNNNIKIKLSKDFILIFSNGLNNQHSHVMINIVMLLYNIIPIALLFEIRQC